LVPPDAKAAGKAMQRFLKDLLGLAGPFGRVAAAYHPERRQWKPLADLAAMTRTPAGRAWLRGCLLRVYAPEDYLARWRQYFANRLGFSVIPGGDDEDAAAAPVKQVETVGALPIINSALELDALMREAGLTDAALAARLGLSRSYVSGQRSGRRPWSKAFQAGVAALLAARAKE
jgi:hypothetical protein